MNSLSRRDWLKSGLSIAAAGAASHLLSCSGQKSFSVTNANITAGLDPIREKLNVEIEKSGRLYMFNENPIGASEKVKHVISEKEIWDNMRFYDYSVHFTDVLTEKISQLENVDKKNIYIGPGSRVNLYEILSSFKRMGGKNVFTHDVEYYAIDRYSTELGLKIKTFPFPKGSVEHALESYLPYDHGSSLFYLSSPHLPFGTFLDLDKADWLLKKIKHAIVIIDEAYIEYMGDHFREVSSKNLLKKYKNLFISRTFSKAYGIASQRVGYLMAQPELKEKFMPSHHRFWIMNAVGVRCAGAAIDDNEHLQKSRNYANKMREEYTEKMKKVGLFTFPSKTNFIAIFAPYNNKNSKFRSLRELGTLWSEQKLGLWLSDHVQAFSTYLGMLPEKEMSETFDRLVKIMEKNKIV